jgi:rod shape-determining protein MreD
MLIDIGRQLLASLGSTIRDVIPIVAVIAFFQFVVLRRPVAAPARLLLGLVAVIAGLAVFLVGLLVRRATPVTGVVGLLLGAAVDSMSPAALGAGALGMTLMAFGASRLKAAFFVDDLGLNAGFVFLGKVFYDVVATLAEGRLTGMTLVWQLFAWTPLSAVATAAVGMVVLAVVRPASSERRFR